MVRSIEVSEGFLNVGAVVTNDDDDYGMVRMRKRKGGGVAQRSPCDRVVPEQQRC